MTGWSGGLTRTVWAAVQHLSSSFYSPLEMSPAGASSLTFGLCWTQPHLKVTTTTWSIPIFVHGSGYCQECKCLCKNAGERTQSIQAAEQSVSAPDGDEIYVLFFSLFCCSSWSLSPSPSSPRSVEWHRKTTWIFWRGLFRKVSPVTLCLCWLTPGGRLKVSGFQNTCEAGVIDVLNWNNGVRARSRTGLFALAGE